MLASLSVITAGAAARTILGAVDQDARRLRQVEADPRLASRADLELLVRAHGVREDKVWAVTDRIAAADLDPETTWAWTMLHDGTELADLCRSHLSDHEVRRHLRDGTLPSDVELPAELGAGARG